MGLGIAGHVLHFIPIIAYLGFPIMIFISLGGKPLWGLYYLLPFIPYRAMRNHFLDYPMGESMLTILIVAVIVGALIHGKRVPPSMLYPIWFVIGVYLYFSMWIGAAMGNSPPPLWLHDLNFVTWKDYVLIPLVFLATALVVEDRKAVRTIIIITAVSLLFIDRSCILEATSRTWTNFDEDKRDVGPLSYGSNLTAAFLAQYAMFIWGVLQFVKKKKFKLMGYGLIALTMYATMYSFSRGAYLAVLFSVLVLGILKDRKLLVILGVFLLTWQTVVPTAVHQRITMTQNSNGDLDSSAEGRIILWRDALDKFAHSPIVGNGFASFQYGEHVGNLKDTHNWFVKILVETGLVGLFLYLILIQQMLAVSFRLFTRGVDPLYKGLGLGLVLAMCSSLVANCFGDRWTYLEITGPMWVLVATAVRALQLVSPKPASEMTPIAMKASVVAQVG